MVFFCGLTPWLFFSETLGASTQAIAGNPHLFKKVLFPTEILPLVNVTAGLISHAVMLIILMLVLLVYGILPALYNLQFVYYTFALCAFTLGLSWFFSALNVFYRDVREILTVILNVWFWLTPIVWPLDILPEKYHVWLKLNPLYYVIQGYRNSFVYHVPFWADWVGAVCFWSMCMVFLFLGAFVFRPLKPDFPEVL